MQSVREPPFLAAWHPDYPDSKDIEGTGFGEIVIARAPERPDDDFKRGKLALLAGSQEAPGYRAYWIGKNRLPSITVFMEIKAIPELLEQWKAVYRISVRDIGDTDMILYVLDVERVDSAT